MGLVGAPSRTTDLTNIWQKPSPNAAATQFGVSLQNRQHSRPVGIGGLRTVLPGVTPPPLYVMSQGPWTTCWQTFLPPEEDEGEQALLPAQQSETSMHRSRDGKGRQLLVLRLSPLLVPRRRGFGLGTTSREDVEGGNSLFVA